MGFLTTKAIFDMPTNFVTVSLFILFTYIPDLDGIFSMFLMRKKLPEAGQMIDFLKQVNLKEAATHATMHHKKFDRLFIHNLLGLSLTLMLYLTAGINNNHVFLSIFGAILTHFIFDIGDDIYLLGHAKNWLWPYYVIIKHER